MKDNWLHNVAMATEFLKTVTMVVAKSVIWR